MNWFKTFFWMAALTVILVGVGGWLFGRSGLVIALLVALVGNGVAYFFGDRMALAAAQAREVGPLEAPVLHRLADRLAAEYGVPKPRVYVSPDPSPNAFATGRSPAHASICVNEGLLRLLDQEEVYGVLAHEFAHVRNRDILISTVVAVLAGAITFLANIAQWGLFWGGGREEEDQSPLGGIGLVLLAVLAPIAALLIQLAVSRSREYEADHTGASASSSGRPRWCHPRPPSRPLLTSTWSTRSRAARWLASSPPIRRWRNESGVWRRWPGRDDRGSRLRSRRAARRRC